MTFRRTSVVPAIVLSLVIAAPVLGGQNNQDRARQDQQDLQAIVKIADAAAAGTAAPTDIPIRWVSNHFFGGGNGVVYIPYAFAIDGRALQSSDVVLYIRVVSRTPQPAPAAAQGNNRNNDRNRQAASMYPWEQRYFLDVKGNATVGRPMQLAPGTYDVILVARERTPAQQPRNAPPQKVGVLRHELVVPSFFNNELKTSSILLSEGVEPLTAAPTAEQQDANPFLLGGLRFAPIMDARARKGRELQLAFYLYGVGNKEGKPDVLIERSFFVRMGDMEKPFVRMQPEELNAAALPAQFDLNAGHPLLSVVDIPVKSNFPEGDYRIEIKITDRIGGKTITESVPFSVIPD